MISLIRRRKTFRRHVSRSLSDDGRPTLWRSQTINALSSHEIVRRPTVYSAPLQVLDQADPDFGKPYFLPDYDPPDNPEGLPLR